MTSLPWTLDLRRQPRPLRVASLTGPRVRQWATGRAPTGAARRTTNQVVDKLARWHGLVSQHHRRATRLQHRHGSFRACLGDTGPAVRVVVVRTASCSRPNPDKSKSPYLRGSL